jgi:hypothetical protein
MNHNMNLIHNLNNENYFRNLIFNKILEHMNYNQLIFWSNANVVWMIFPKHLRPAEHQPREQIRRVASRTVEIVSDSRRHSKEQRTAGELKEWRGSVRTIPFWYVTCASVSTTRTISFVDFNQFNQDVFRVYYVLHASSTCHCAVFRSSRFFIESLGFT